MGNNFIFNVILKCKQILSDFAFFTLAAKLSTEKLHTMLDTITTRQHLHTLLTCHAYNCLFMVYSYVFVYLYFMNL